MRNISDSPARINLHEIESFLDIPVQMRTVWHGTNSSLYKTFCETGIEISLVQPLEDARQSVLAIVSSIGEFEANYYFPVQKTLLTKEPRVYVCASEEHATRYAKVAPEIRQILSGRCDEFCDTTRKAFGQRFEPELTQYRASVNAINEHFLRSTPVVLGIALPSIDSLSHLKPSDEEYFLKVVLPFSQKNGIPFSQLLVGHGGETTLSRSLSVGDIVEVRTL